MENTIVNTMDFDSEIGSEIVLGNKAYLPFPGAQWRPIPASIAKEYHITKLHLQVSDFGAVCTPKGLVKAHPMMVEHLMKHTDVVSLQAYTDFDSAVSICKYSKTGEPVLRILKNGKEINLKRIVAEAFVPNPNGKPCITCLNGDGFDVSAGNLMWMTRAEKYRFTVDGVLPDIMPEKKNLMFGIPGAVFDYATRTLRIDNIPLSEYNAVTQRINAAGRPDKAPDCAKIYFLIKYWSEYGICDFSRQDLSQHIGIGMKTACDDVDLLIKSDLLTYDKELWSKRKGAYEYFINPPQPVDMNGSIYLVYPCKGTALDETFVELVKSLRDDVYTPEYRDEWDNIAYLTDMHPSYYYESRYGDLTYRYTTDKNDITGRIRECRFVTRCVSKMKKPFSYTEISGRAYPAFAMSDKEYRHGFEFEGSPLTELVDIHCSFYTLLTSLLAGKVPEEERKAYFKRCITGKLYDDCMKYVNKGRQKEKLTRDKVKDIMQAWRNDVTGASSSKKVQEFMEINYPNIKRVIDDWPTYTDNDGKAHKLLQRDCGTFETRIMSKLAHELTDKYNVSCFLLHDAIYVSEKEVAEKLPANIQKLIIKWLETNLL